MYDIENLLNISSNFSFISDTEISFIGSLIRSEKNIILECNATYDIYTKLKDKEIVIIGSVENTPLTLINASINSLRTSDGVIFHLKITPSEIIIGEKYKNKIFVTKISSNISVLNYMFSKKPLREICNFSKNNPAVVEYTYPNNLSATDDDGYIEVYESFRFNQNTSKIEMNFIPIVEYNFNSPTELMDAVAKIASARNLFSFFADYYIPMENITFADKSSKFCDKSLYMNYIDDIDVPKKPFIIQTNMLENNFINIWKKWSQFYNSGLFIQSLFYEIICNRSTKINRFLNLTQAIEQYSNKYRNDEAWKISEIPKKNADSILSLKYRINDIFVWLNNYFELTNEQINNIAKGINDQRNFFTHYNKNRYREPTHQEIDSSSIVLQFILLSIIYKTIGIPDEYIKDAKSLYSFGNLPIHINSIIKYNLRA